MGGPKTPEVLHLHTYFLFPFSVDKRVVQENHRGVWARNQHWIDGVDQWVCSEPDNANRGVKDALGNWKRAAYTRFDMASPAYQNMVFFHPFVRRIFFDTIDTSGVEKESLLRCYVIPIAEELRLWLHAEDTKQRSASVEVTDLRLFMFANGIGILSIGVEADHLPTAQALWINESVRKVYPSSARQIREGRVPSSVRLELEKGGERKVLALEEFQEGEMIGFLPPMSKIITSLIYFADYREQEFEPVLDERMIVYTYVALNPDTIEEGYLESEEYQVLLSRFLYVDNAGANYRYERDFIQNQMRRHVYRRWAHQGTYYGFTSYSNLTATIGTFDCEEHSLLEGFLIHRMFDTRYYLMTMVALFYRATLLDFAERSALVSKRIFMDQEDGRLTPENIRIASDLRGEFLHFSNYWYFDELANKDEEIEHFAMQCRQFRIEPIKREIEEEIEKLNASLRDYAGFRNTDAVNRLAMLSLIVGAGAVLTGFFGMNFGRNFSRYFFEPDPSSPFLHYLAIALVTVLAFGALAFGFFMVAANWSDYRDILLPGRRARTQGSLKRD